MGLLVILLIVVLILVCLFFYESQGERLLCSKGSLDDQCIIVCKTGIRMESLEVIGHIFLVIGILSMKKFIDEINQKIGE